jgi:threonine dehydrogenase-like Zn-dependent dehydrogenase
MRGLVLAHGLSLQTDRPKPTPKPQEAIIQVLQAGICPTDLHLVKGYMDFQGVLGHEFVGVVDHAPGNSSLIGKRVVGEINAACRVCPTCQNGRPTHCPNRTTLGIMGRDGAFADYLSLPVENLFLVPDGMTNEQAVFIEPLAAACEIPQLVAIKPTDRVIIIGDGKLGLLCAQVLSLTGSQVTLLGRHSERHAWLIQKGILVDVRNPGYTSRGRYCRRRSHGKLPRAHHSHPARPATRNNHTQIDIPRGGLGQYDRISYSRNIHYRFTLWPLCPCASFISRRND